MFLTALLRERTHPNVPLLTLLIVLIPWKLVASTARALKHCKYNTNFNIIHRKSIKIKKNVRRNRKKTDCATIRNKTIP